MPLFSFASPGVLDIQCVSSLQVTVSGDTCELGQGSIILEHDGDAPFTYTWSHDSTLNDSIATGLTPGDYTISVVDSGGCTADTTVTLGNFNPLSLISVGFGDDTCGAPNGYIAIEVSPAGAGTPPYTFQWDSLAGNQTTQVATDLRGGSYTVVATDAAGCEVSREFSIGSVSNGFDGATLTTDVLCYGDSNGTANVSPVGGNGVYAYAWTLPGDSVVLSADSTLSGVPEGVYQIVLTDPNGEGDVCLFSQLVTINQPDSVRASFQVMEASDCTTEDGEAIAVPIGGTPPYDISWSTGDTTDTLSNIRPGFYSLTVTDTFGCENTKTVIISSFSGPDFEIEILQEDNCGLGEGIARINILTGTAPYEIQWWTRVSQLQDSTTSDFLQYNLFRTDGGTYTVVIEDADSCVNQVQFQMPGNPPLQVDDISSTVNYCELANGTTSISVSGGTLPYTYEWTTSPVQRNATATGLVEGTYLVTVRDSFNCDIGGEIEVGTEAGFDLEVRTTDVSCYGADDGTARALTFGNGRFPFRYTWENSSSRESSLENLEAGIYTVTVVDDEGCTRTGFNEVGAVNFINADFTAMPDTNTPVVLSSAAFEFTNLSEGGDSYIWDFGDGNLSTEFNPTHVYADTGQFFVTLRTFTNDFQCVDSMVLGPYVVAIDGVIFVPNAFTPNGDGFNDFFEVKGELVEQYQLRVFDRWGVEIFSASSLEDSWNGRLPGGKAAPQGVYVYHMTANIPGEKEVQETGTITLIR
ncbi:MAG: gliding motility-associated C-terminal domain-containing protein [Bacteroidota bacterium]